MISSLSCAPVALAGATARRGAARGTAFRAAPSRLAAPRLSTPLVLPPERLPRRWSHVAQASDKYYEEVDGVKYDRGVLEAVREAVAGVGDGRVSKADAEIIWEKVIDANKVTDTERATVEYAMANFKWTDSAKTWFNGKMAEYDASQ